VKYSVSLSAEIVGAYCRAAALFTKVKSLELSGERTNRLHSLEAKTRLAFCGPSPARWRNTSRMPATKPSALNSGTPPCGLSFSNWWSCSWFASAGKTSCLHLHIGESLYCWHAMVFAIEIKICGVKVVA
jgi:hypothetical protein